MIPFVITFCILHKFDKSAKIHVMSELSLVHKIALGMIPGVGDITARKLISYTGSVEAIFEESFRALKQIPGVGESIAGAIVKKEYLLLAEKEAQYVNSHNIRVFFTLTNIPKGCSKDKDAPAIKIARCLSSVKSGLNCRIKI